MRSVTYILVMTCCAVLLLSGSAAAQEPHDIEKIILLRHGEKPRQGLGQLTCQGLNRALLLPDFLAKNFPKPDYIFAPNPSVKATEIHGDGERYDYVRPLVTIAPTAIRLGLPINTQLPYNDPGLLADTLLDPKYRRSTIYVVWEHLNIVSFAEILLTRFHQTTHVPPWDNSDYDTVFVFTIDWSEPRSLKLEVRSEGLGQMSEECPVAKAVR
jgi:hypothetical protein